MTQREHITAYIAVQYAAPSEFLWAKLPDYAVFRAVFHKKAKWFALLARVPNAKLGLKDSGSSDILNLKGDPQMVEILRQDPHIFPAYHMNKKHWFTIRLDQGFPLDELKKLIDWSYRLAEK